MKNKYSIVMKRKILFIITVILALASCNPFGNCETEDEVAIEIVLDLSEVSKAVDNLHIYAFGASDRLDEHQYYSSLAELASEKLFLNHGNYIIIAVLNVGAEFSPPENAQSTQVAKATSEKLANIMLADFIVWLKQVSSQYPDMMTGMNREVTTDDGTRRIVIDIDEGTTNLKTNILLLNITTPGGAMPDYNTRAPHYTSNVADHNRRAVAEVYKKGTVLRVHRHSEILNHSTLNLNLQPGDYDILLWVDHVPAGTDTDHHYLTSSLRGVKFTEHLEYMAGIDSRQAYSIKAGALVTEEPVTVVPAAMDRVFAKYNLVARDVKRYKELRQANGDKYPPLENLVVNVSYNGYFPNSHDVHTDKPNSSGAGVQFNSTLRDITDATTTLASDYILAASIDSGDPHPYVNATVIITDKHTSDVIARTVVRIDYLRGHVTTVESDYLTAGIIDQGITIDTNWDGVIDVYF